MKASKESVVSRTYDLIKTAIPVLNAFPRNYKFTLGDRIQQHLTDLLELYIEAMYLSGTEKVPLLKSANLKLEKIRYLFRLGFDFGLYNSSRYNTFAISIDEIGRMTGAWLKSFK